MNLFSYLNNIDAERLFDMLQDEHLQTIAVVLVHLDKDLAADILNRFPQKTRADIAMRMANSDSLPEMVLQNIANSLKNKIVRLAH